jgi:hypothetical protein
MLPLGYLAHLTDSDVSMTLADYVTWFIQIGTNIAVRSPFFYTLEYV